MKKTLFSLLTAAFTLTFLNAQQMSYYVDMVGVQGQSFILAQDTAIIPGEIDLNTGSVGAGKIWNFQGLDSDKMDTIHFDALTGPEATDFPTGNLVMQSTALGRIIFDADPSTGLFLQGTSIDLMGNPLSLGYTPPQQNLPPVANLGSTSHTLSHVDESFYVGIDQTFGTVPFTCHIVIDSIELKRVSDYTVDFDATGELRLPLDTFTYAIRAMSREVTLDSIFIFCPSGITDPACSIAGLSAPVGWSLAPDALISLSGFATSAVTLDSIFTATWYVPYQISPVCVMDITYDNNYTDTNFVTARFKGVDTPDIGFEQQDEINLSVYPNPASTLLMLQTNAAITNATMYVYNTSGQQVKAIALNGSNVVDVSTLTNGMYFYQLADGNKLLHHGKFIVKK
jgi:hypothetical protein